MKDVVKLILDGVRLSGVAGPALDLTLRGGELVLVTGDAEAFFDIVEGLEDPKEGVVTFLERSWKDMTPTDECRLRGRIGRSFAQGKAWVQNLTIRQNIAIAALHHRALPDNDMQAEIDMRADELEIAPQMDLRPEGIRPSILARSQWIRAFLADPELLLLEGPLQHVSDPHRDPLFAWTREHLARGGVAFWADAAEPISQIQEQASYVLRITESELAIERRQS